MNEEKFYPDFTDFSDSEELYSGLEADMYDECTIGEPIIFEQIEKESEEDKKRDIVLEEMEGMRPQKKIELPQVMIGEMSGNNIPLDPQESERMSEMFNKQDENYLVYYTKCVLYLMQKYGALTTRQMASLIGNLEAKQLYDIINVLCDYKILIRGNKDNRFMFRLFSEQPVPEPICDITILEDEIRRTEDEIQRIQDQIDELP